MRIFCFLFFSIFIITTSNCFGQKVELIHADLLEYNESSGLFAQVLRGNVSFKHNQVYLYCDSAYFFENENRVITFGNVRINENGKFNATCARLEYDGNLNKATMSENVTLTDSKTTLTTPNLLFDTKTGVGIYTNGGTILSQESKIVSNKGQYFNATGYYHFSENVRITHPEFILDSDTLHFASKENKAYFKGLTKFNSKGNIGQCYNGWFNTQTKETYLLQKVTYRSTDNQILLCDTLFYNDLAKNGYTKGKTILKDSINNFLASGKNMQFDKKSNILLIPIEPLLINYSETDTFYIKADTIKQYQTTDTKKVLQAWKNVSGFNKDFSLKCDSLVYLESDSSFNFHKNPIIWPSDFQLSGNFMRMQLENKNPKWLSIENNAFIISKADSLGLFFNQIKGRNLKAYFIQKELSKIEIKGNSESIFYIKDDKPEKGFIGVNQIECSDLQIELEKGEPIKIGFFKKPVGKLLPMSKIDPKTLIIKGFENKLGFPIQIKAAINKLYNSYFMGGSKLAIQSSK